MLISSVPLLMTITLRYKRRVMIAVSSRVTRRPEASAASAKHGRVAWRIQETEFQFDDVVLIACH